MMLQSTLTHLPGQNTSVAAAARLFPADQVEINNNNDDRTAETFCVVKDIPAGWMLAVGFPTSRGSQQASIKIPIPMQIKFIM